MQTIRDLLGIDDQPWMQHPGRNCRPPAGPPIDTRNHADLWHPSETREAYATRLCNGCPVVAQCLAWAIPQTDLTGIVGGKTTAQRAKLRTKARKVAAA